MIAVLVMAMVNGIRAHLTNDEKRAHLTDVSREHLIDQVCVQEILPPKK
jgi:exonuclease III